MYTQIPSLLSRPLLPHPTPLGHLSPEWNSLCYTGFQLTLTHHFFFFFQIYFTHLFFFFLIVEFLIPQSRCYYLHLKYT